MQLFSTHAELVVQAQQLGAIAQELSATSLQWTAQEAALIHKIQAASDRLNDQLAHPLIDDLSRYRHDLRTPLTVILGYCELMLSRAPQPIPQLSAVYQQGQVVLQAINQWSGE
ncbi:histidine kinase dimerization/phospho-acceptor domain-containing protein [Parathermosynechococcus lividus]